jgi:hypothetical protein
MGRKAVVITVCLGVMCGVHAIDALIRHKHIQDLLEDENAGAQAIAAYYGLALSDCGYRPDDPLHSLMHAIFTAERLATPYLSGQLRTAAILINGYVWLPPLDISAGVGRIRLTTARKYLGKNPTPDAYYYASLSDRDLANALLDRCHAFRIGLAILSEEKRQYPEKYQKSNALFIRHVARIYVGKAQIWTSLEAALSHEIYFRLVYNLFQIYRFSADYDPTGQL